MIWRELALQHFSGKAEIKYLSGNRPENENEKKTAVKKTKGKLECLISNDGY